MAHVRDLFSLSGQSAVVIGGAGKIGFPMSEALAEAGARVWIASPHDESIERAVGRLAAAGHDVRGVRVDQSDQSEVERLVRETSADGVPSVLVNCGVERPMRKLLDDTPEAWDRSMAVNARGLFVTCRAFGRAMAAAGGGSVINVGSVYGIVAPDPGIYEGTDVGTEPDYPYTKGGMIQFTRYLATYFAKARVRFNCICPGGLYNQQDSRFVERYNQKVPLGRMAVPDDLKGATVFLASRAADYVTGVILAVDGGFTVW
jgi:NAD(P)-dependent dehydrogenase (short-subunit alcohol dehydrogenase family)